MPAWKRLGLKLKYAKDIPVTSRQAPNDTNGTNNTEKHTAERPAKRARLAENVHNVTAPDHMVSSTTDQSLSTTTINGAVNASKQDPSRRKSVTFTNDTKIEDGDSRTTIDFPAGSLGATTKRKASTSLETGSGSTTNGFAAESTSSASNQAETGIRSKKKITKKSVSPGSLGQARNKNSLALNYLNQHRNAHEEWKFNKNRDVWIMVHAVKKDGIPDSHVAALAGYVRGLPPASGARRRLIEQCQENLQQVEDDANDVADDRERFLEALETKANDVLDSILERTPRPQVLLWALDVDIPHRDTSATAQILPKRKKKRRTDISDISSSSSSSSSSESESSSESDNENYEGKKSLLKQAKGSINTKELETEETSSDDESSDSSSSNDSE